MHRDICLLEDLLRPPPRLSDSPVTGPTCRGQPSPASQIRSGFRRTLAIPRHTAQQAASEAKYADRGQTLGPTMSRSPAPLALVGSDREIFPCRTRSLGRLRRQGYDEGALSEGLFQDLPAGSTHARPNGDTWLPPVRWEVP